MSERIVHIYLDGRRMSRASGLDVRIAKDEVAHLTHLRSVTVINLDASIWLMLPAKRRGAVAVIVDVFHRHVIMDSGPVYRLAGTFEGLWRDVHDTAVECT